VRRPWKCVGARSGGIAGIDATDFCSAVCVGISLGNISLSKRCLLYYRPTIVGPFSHGAGGTRFRGRIATRPSGCKGLSRKRRTHRLVVPCCDNGRLQRPPPPFADADE
jgi:hypothetical protein